VLVYVQTSQQTTCFGLFHLGHLQVGHKGQRNYTIMQYACVQTGLHTCLKFCKRDLVPPHFNDNIALLYSSSELYVQHEGGLTGRDRNM